jgi:protein-arginine kinase activator protein McsA
MICEACGVQGVNVQTTHIRTTNGSLYLCKLCLDDINRKNPEIAELKKRIAELEAGSDSASGCVGEPGAEG